MGSSSGGILITYHFSLSFFLFPLQDMFQRGFVDVTNVIHM